MAGAFIVLFLFIGVVGFMVFVVVRQLKKRMHQWLEQLLIQRKLKLRRIIYLHKIENNIIDLGGFK